MYLTHYAPWEHYPKTLILKEFMDPLSVVDDFFSCDSLEGHAERLKEWRYYAVNDKVYKDKDVRRSPGGLLFEYDMNLKLLEAVYLLFLNYRTYSYRWKEATEHQIELEKEQWGYELTNLSEKEWQNPYKALKKIFKEIGPQHYRDYLHDLLHSAFYKRADLDAFNACEVVTVYENMLKLYSAAWLILNREKDKSKPAPQQVETEITEQSEISEIRSINPSPTQDEQPELNKLKNLIVERFPCVEMIVYLGYHEPSQLIFLLVLISDNEKTQEHEVSNKIEDNCQHLTKVQTIVHKSNSAKEALNMGRRFWATVLDKGFVLYQSPELTLPSHQEITNDILLERAKFNWERWGVQGKEFLKGAELYKGDINFRLAAFLLHQAVESVLKAIIQAVIGYRVQMHNLTRLIRLTLLFSDDLNNVFNLDSDEDVKTFTLLQCAYSKSRYDSDFDPDEQSIEILSEKAKRFCAVAEGIYNRYLQKLQPGT